MQPISQHDLNRHRQRLREIFGLSFRAKQGVPFDVEEKKASSPRGAVVWYVLKKSDATEFASSDRDEEDVCAVLCEKTDKRILCSFLEKWILVNPKNLKYKFEKVGMTFFLCFKHGQEEFKKQIFRLEWDDWVSIPPNKAAYPHWQFDTWLTASKPTVPDELKGQFQASTDEVRVFEPPAEQKEASVLAADRPSLSWFTLLHFPVIAPWNTKPIETQSHRSMPETLKELEDWIDSALQYLKSELNTYG